MEIEYSPKINIDDVDHQAWCLTADGLDIASGVKATSTTEAVVKVVFINPGFESAVEKFFNGNVTCAKEVIYV